MATERDKPRLAASTTSASETCEEADGNSEGLVATTLAIWLFLLRSAMEMASSSLPSLSAPATCCTNTRDCLRAALYIRARSIITPSDHAERINRMNTTALAMRLMLPHIERKSHVPACNASGFSADTAKFTTIRFAPFLFAHFRPGPSHEPAPAGYFSGKDCLISPLRLATEDERYGDARINFHGLAIQLGRLIAPVLDGLQRRLHQKRVPRNDLQFADPSVLIDDRMQNYVALNTRLPRHRRIIRLRLGQKLCRHNLPPHLNPSLLRRIRRGPAPRSTAPPPPP